MSTCNRFDLQTLGSQLIMPKNLPDHWVGTYVCDILRLGLLMNECTLLNKWTLI